MSSGHADDGSGDSSRRNERPHRTTMSSGPADDGSGGSNRGNELPRSSNPEATSVPPTQSPQSSPLAYTDDQAEAAYIIIPQDPDLGSALSPPSLPPSYHVQGTPPQQPHTQQTGPHNPQTASTGAQHPLSHPQSGHSTHYTPMMLYGNSHPPQVGPHWASWAPWGCNAFGHGYPTQLSYQAPPSYHAHAGYQGHGGYQAPSYQVPPSYIAHHGFQAPPSYETMMGYRASSGRQAPSGYPARQGYQAPLTPQGPPGNAPFPPSTPIIQRGGFSPPMAPAVPPAQLRPAPSSHDTRGSESQGNTSDAMAEILATMSPEERQAQISAIRGFEQTKFATSAQKHAQNPIAPAARSELTMPKPSHCDPAPRKFSRKELKKAGLSRDEPTLVLDFQPGLDAADKQWRDLDAVRVKSTFYHPDQCKCEHCAVGTQSSWEIQSPWENQPTWQSRPAASTGPSSPAQNMFVRLDRLGMDTGPRFEWAKVDAYIRQRHGRVAIAYTGPEGVTEYHVQSLTGPPRRLRGAEMETFRASTMNVVVRPVTSPRPGIQRPAITEPGGPPRHRRAAFSFDREVPGESGRSVFPSRPPMSTTSTVGSASNPPGSERGDDLLRAILQRGIQRAQQRRQFDLSPQQAVASSSGTTTYPRVRVNDRPRPVRIVDESDAYSGGMFSMVLDEDEAPQRVRLPGRASSLRSTPSIIHQYGTSAGPAVFAGYRGVLGEPEERRPAVSPFGLTAQLAEGAMASFLSAGGVVNPNRASDPVHRDSRDDGAVGFGSSHVSGVNSRGAVIGSTLDLVEEEDDEIAEADDGR